MAKFNPEEHNFDRNYFEKIHLLAEQLGEEWKKRVFDKINYKDPSLWPHVVSQLVWEEIKPSSQDQKSVLVYAILTEQTEEAMREYMVKDGK